jgi:hypothetical protein
MGTKGSTNSTDREEKNCYEVITKAVETHEVVAENTFHAKQKARSVVSHTYPVASVGAVKVEEIDRENCYLSADSEQ